VLANEINYSNRVLMGNASIRQVHLCSYVTISERQPLIYKIPPLWNLPSNNFIGAVF